MNGGIVASAPVVTLKPTSRNLQIMANTWVISFNNARISLGADVATQSKLISGLDALTASGTIVGVPPKTNDCVSSLKQEYITTDEYNHAKHKYMNH